jgi:hypothetical protein
MKLSRLLLAALLPLAACDDLTGIITDPDAPGRLTYQLIPSGDPDAPLGVLLSWQFPTGGAANSFNVYARSTTNGTWNLRATTTSLTFHDMGVPERQYYVATRDANGNELAESDVVTIDLVSPRLPAPQGLTSISLNAAVQLSWRPNAVEAGGDRFDHYIVYSAPYDAARGVCTSSWAMEGSTVADAFYAGNLTNGTTRCFAVSAVTTSGHESVWSAQRVDTPRFDARNAFVYNTTARRDSSGFLFAEEVTRRTGVVGSSTRTDLDVIVERQTDGTMWFVPGRTGVTMMLYSTTPVADLSSIDRAATSGFTSNRYEAVPGYAYVFRVTKADGVHYAAIRVAFRTTDYVVFDWSYQSAPGNAELNRTPE